MVVVVVHNLRFLAGFVTLDSNFESFILNLKTMLLVRFEPGTFVLKFRTPELTEPPDFSFEIWVMIECENPNQRTS